MRTTARIFSVALLSLGLITGCASTGDSSGADAIAAAKAANAEAKSLNYEWRDTGKIIKKAEAKLAAGAADASTFNKYYGSAEKEAISLANKAKKQADIAISQAHYENRKFLDDNTDGSATVGSSSRGAGAGVSSYSVVNGDNLWSISGKAAVYANPFQWPLIYKTNRNKIKDADLIFSGQVFDIDQNASASEIDAAVNHAKTRGAWSVGDSEQSDSDYLAK